jgi:hypothetical protein
MDKIPLKQRRFADNIISGENGTQSAIKAGYAKASAHTTSSRLLKNEKVQAYIQAAMDKASEQTGINAQYVLTTIQQTMEQCKQPIDSGHVDSQGQPVMIPVDVQGVLRSSEQLGRSLSLFQDRTLHSHTGLESMSEEELDRELAKATQTRDLVATQDLSEVH